MVYLLGNGSGKTRVDRRGAARAVRTWRLVFLSTGEKDLATKLGETGTRAMAGQEVRMPSLDADPGAGLGVFQALHGEADGAALAERLDAATRRQDGSAGPAFLERLAALRATDPAGLARRLTSAVQATADRLAPPGSEGQARTLARHFGLLAAAGELAVEFGVLPWPPGEATRGAEACFRRPMERRDGPGRAEDRAAVERVRGFVERYGESRFQDADAGASALPVRDRVGFRAREADGSWGYLFLPGPWREEVCRGLDPAAAAKALDEAGCLARDAQARHRSRSMRLPGLSKTRVYHVTGRIFEVGQAAHEEAPPPTAGRPDASATHGRGTGGAGGTAVADPARRFDPPRHHGSAAGTTGRASPVFPPDNPDAVRSRALPVGGTTGTTGTIGTASGDSSGDGRPALLPPAWSDPTLAPRPGAFCGCCGGTAWWTEREAPRGWRCVRCHPPAGISAGDLREART